MSTLRDVGEFGLIDRISRLFPTSPDVLVGTGDDCAVLKTGDETLLVTCDLSVEGVHFRRTGRTPADIGWKALAVSLSDIAAMGGVPQFALVSVAAPPETEAAFLEALATGIAEAARYGATAVVGGDTTHSEHGVIIDTMVIGRPAGARYVTRQGARDGDLLCLTGPTGLSGAGFLLLEEERETPGKPSERRQDLERLTGAHVRPAPRIAEGRWLAGQTPVRALIDVSDGVAQDGGHLAQAAALGLDFESRSVAIDPALEAFGRREPVQQRGASPLMLALTAGEDYELAFALAPEAWEDVAAGFAERFGRAPSIAGRFSSAHRELRLDGAPLTYRGFDHFA